MTADRQLKNIQPQEAARNLRANGGVVLSSIAADHLDAACAEIERLKLRLSEDGREELIQRLFDAFQASVGSVDDKQKFAFIAGARSMAYELKD